VPPHDVHVWYQATDAFDDAAIAAAVSVLSDEERAQYCRFHFAGDARDYAAAHALLRLTLSRGGDRAPNQWHFDRDAGGKPFLVDPGAFRASFSLSHAHGMVACAVTAAGDVGVDVECIDRDVNTGGIAARFFAPAEAADLKQLDGDARRHRFFDLWTLKEALVKALGTGLATSLASLAFTLDAGGRISLDAPSEVAAHTWQFGLFSPGPGHRLAVAARHAEPEAVQLIFRSSAHDA
jgi:4'-phosphopantetheinyl transferase